MFLRMLVLLGDGSKSSVALGPSGMLGQMADSGDPSGELLLQDLRLEWGPKSAFFKKPSGSSGMHVVSGPTL